MLPLPPADQGKASGAQTERVLKLMRDYSKVRDAQPATDALARSSGFDQRGQISTEALAQSPWRDPSQALVLDQALIVKAIAAGVRNGTWICHDAASGTVLTGQEPHGQVRIAEDVFLYTVERAKELGLLPEPPVTTGPTPRRTGGATDVDEDGAGSRDHGGSRAPRLVEVHGGAADALQKLDDAIRDTGARHLSQISARVAAEAGQGVQPFRILGMCVGQLARFEVGLKLDATVEFAAIEGSASLVLEGSARDCAAVFEALWAALDGASDIAGSLTLTASQRDAMACDGADYRQFAEVLRRAAPGHLTLKAEVAERSSGQP